ncbi:MAG TPA: glycosyltransferase [Candidatus Dormibacteraeota bacterium]|nr:glycosyltransferase [Candidatus Dormibacteraeota bacterium]
MSRPDPDDPCYAPPVRSLLPGPQKVRVVEVLATGTNGGAQEHVYNLLTRIDRSRYDVSVVSLSSGSAVRKLQHAGVPVCVIDEPDDAIAVGALATYLAGVQPDVVHDHMYRAEVVGTKAVLALQAAGHPRPYVVSTVHSSRVRAHEDRELLRQLTPEMDKLIAVSRAIVSKIEDEGRTGAPVELIYNGVDLERYDHQEPCCTLRAEYGMEDGSLLVGVVARLEPEKGHPTLLEAWPHVLRQVPDAYLLVVGEGSRREALEEQVRELRIGQRVVFTGRRDDVPAVTAALDVAVLPSYREAQGLTILEAMALSRPVVATNVGGIPEVVQDGVSGLLVPPHDADALAGAIVRLLTDHPFADTLAKAGHDAVHERFCVELMVHAIEAVYDEGARTIRLAEVAVG